MSTVRLSFSPAAAHVRTARLVGVAVARRAGVAEELLEEIRLAIGEACSRAVALHRSHGVDDLVDVVMEDGLRFTVRVIDRAGDGPGLGPPPTDPGLFLDEPRSGNGSISAPATRTADVVQVPRGADVGRVPRGADVGRVPYGADVGQVPHGSDVVADLGYEAGAALAGQPAEDPTDSLTEEVVAARMGLALLVGLVDDLVVASVADGLGTEVSMSWPVERRMSDR